MSKSPRRPSVATRHQLIVQQADRIEAILLQRRRELVNAIHGESFEPFATCPRCRHEFSGLEIVRGFRGDMREIDCPKCAHGFQPSLRYVTGGATVNLTYFSTLQTLALLEGSADTTPDEFMDANPALYYSAIVNFGGLAQAFKLIGVTYAHAEELDWREAVVPFLGTLPDPVIADFVGTTPSSIRRMRNRRGVPPYNRRNDAVEKAA